MEFDFKLFIFKQSFEVWKNMSSSNLIFMNIISIIDNWHKIVSTFSQALSSKIYLSIFCNAFLVVSKEFVCV